MFYLLHGEDGYSRSLALAEMKAKLGDPTTVAPNTTTLDGRTATLDELIFACDTVPFLSDKRLVVVTDLATRFEPRRDGRKAQSEQDKSLLKGLREYLKRLPETARLVFLERKSIRKSNPIHQVASNSAHGYVREFKPPRRRNLNRWIVRRVQGRRRNIEPGAVSLLAAFVGNDLRLLDQELEKLLTYAGQERAITRRDVQLMVSYVREASIFDLVDAVGRRDSRQAMKLLHSLLEEGQHPLYVLAMITRQFRILLRIKELLAKGTSVTDIRTLMGLHPYVLKKMLRQAPNFSIAQLQSIYRDLLEIDVAAKTGGMKPELALDLFVTELQRQT